MTEDNTTPAPAWDPIESVDPSNRDPVTGRLLPGHTLKSPGRGPNTLDFMAIARAKSKESKIPLDDLVWLATKGLATRAARGDAAAAKVLLDRMCGPTDKGVEVKVDARTAIAAGPQVPEGGDFADWVRGLNRVAAQQELLNGATPDEVVADAVDDLEAEAELLG